MATLHLAVVVPVFDRPSAVLEALDSVAAQTRPPDDLIVVDDGSTGDTATQVDAWLAQHSLSFPARLIRQARRGVSAARNRGVRAAADADLIAFLDSDDLWPENYLAAHDQALFAHPLAVASTCDKDSTDVPSGARRRAERKWVEYDTTREIARRGPPGVSNTVVRGADFRATGGFDESLETAEDLDLMLRLSVRGAWIHVAETSAFYRHRLGETRGEAASLGHLHTDRRRTRAEVLDAFRSNVESADPGLARDLRKVVGRQWARAGRQLQQEGRGGEAAECFDRAIAAWPLDLRSRWARLYSGGARQRRL